MTHAASAPISQTGRLSPAALAFAVVLHVLAVIGLLYLTPFRPFKMQEEAIEIVIDGSVPPPMPEAVEPEPQPTPPQPPQPQTLAMPKAPPGPPAEQVVPPPEPPPPPPMATDFPIPAPPPQPPAPPKPQPPQQAQQPPPQQQPRPPVNNQASVPQPSPLRGPNDIIFGPRNPSSTDYFTALARQLAQRRYYPQSARDRHQMGRVVMRVTIARDGRLLEAKVERSSGVPAIDAAELDTVTKSAPFPPLPFTIAGDSATFLLPVTYELR